MFEQVNKVLKNIFSNEETIVFSLAILLFFLVISFFGSILTPFMISIVVAYLLVGMQKKIQLYDVSANVALIITFSVFIITGAALLIWLVPLLYIQLQAFILDVPKSIANMSLSPNVLTVHIVCLQTVCDPKRLQYTEI